ncbi:type I-E CRISPR-associated protein Cas6/Cse3/CasE [Streptomyces triculaminicus]|uniref:Type I-E CRISPR-associated protein Cas6/Cse3/CasE n=1 Tax=Streptomyces triculaminicus TaxID=2816232 RepID=A0A939FTW3_9ACTN|nr:type I-E CRISPR-associated protein Cas6/Cse3/CasE [Streptomyces triculaminicus]MBO0657264.1 type I-E CRISPR-associated protein Cas6/Cse3/CasE [Streptomyces triculaminicus]
MTTAPAAPTRTLHLAQLHLEARSRAVHQDLNDATKLHNTVQSLFPDTLGDTPRAATHTLFRLEREQAGAVLLIQSTLPINRNALPRGYAHHLAHRDLGPLLDWITEGRLVRYRIDANPIKTTFVRGQRGKRTPVTGAEALAWWERQAHKAGLANQLALDLPQPPVRGTRNNSKPILLRAMRFEGVATVTDADALRAAITVGIGQGRAYGLGLLSIAPYRP